MTTPITLPYTFQHMTGTIPLKDLDDNFARLAQAVADQPTLVFDGGSPGTIIVNGSINGGGVT